MKCCLICGKLITNRGKYYDIGIGSTCYRKNYKTISVRAVQAKMARSYKHKLGEDKSILDLPLFEALNDNNNK